MVEIKSCPPILTAAAAVLILESGCLLFIAFNDSLNHCLLGNFLDMSSCNLGHWGSLLMMTLSEVVGSVAMELARGC